MQGFAWRWDYPHSKSVKEADRAGTSANLILRTDDPVEKVILWYAKQTALPDDHSLVESMLDAVLILWNPVIALFTFRHSSVLTGRTSVLGDFSATHVHIALTFQPSRDDATFVVVSITSSLNGRASTCSSVQMPDSNCMKRSRRSGWF